MKKLCYLDSSILIEYHSANNTNSENHENEDKLKIIFDKFIKQNSRIKFCEKLKKILTSNNSPLDVVVSPLSLIEYHEWFSETIFKNELALKYNFNRIGSKSKKNIGDFYYKLMKEVEFDFSKDCGENSILNNAFLDPNIVVGQQLEGLRLIDINELNISIDNVWSKYCFFSILQMGLADIMHLITAINFGCQYFLTFDNDFKRVKEILKKHEKIEIIAGVNELKDFIR